MLDDTEDEFENEFGEDFEDFDLETEQTDLEGSNTFAPETDTNAASRLKKLAGLAGIFLVAGLVIFFTFKGRSSKVETLVTEKPLPAPAEQTIEAPPQQQELAQEPPSSQPQEQAKSLYDDLFQDQRTLATTPEKPSPPPSTTQKLPTEIPTQSPTEADPDTPKLFDTISGIKKELFGDEERARTLSEQEAFSVQQTQALQQALNVFSQKMQINTEQIQTLEDTLTEVAKALNNVSQSVGKINNEVSDLSNTTHLLSNEYQNIKKVIQSEDLDITSDPIDGKPKAKPITYTGPEYVVHAVIPGRAWLKSHNGEILTVSEGDLIGNYGKILVIDASNGVIMTSSGIAFR